MTRVLILGAHGQIARMAIDLFLKGEPFQNPSATVSRRSVASLVVQLATTPGLASRSSLGVHRAQSSK